MTQDIVREILYFKRLGETIYLSPSSGKTIKVNDMNTFLEKKNQAILALPQNARQPNSANGKVMPIYKDPPMSAPGTPRSFLNRSSTTCSDLFTAVRENDFLKLISLLQISPTASTASMLPFTNPLLETTDVQGQTPLHYSTIHGYKTIVEILLSAGANPNARILSDGTSPLHLAFARSYYCIVRVLLKHGGSLELQDFDGNTPVHFAYRYCKESDKEFGEISKRPDFEKALLVKNHGGMTPIELKISDRERAMILCEESKDSSDSLLKIQ